MGWIFFGVRIWSFGQTQKWPSWHIFGHFLPFSYLENDPNVPFWLIFRHFCPWMTQLTNFFVTNFQLSGNFQHHTFQSVDWQRQKHHYFPFFPFFPASSPFLIEGVLRSKILFREYVWSTQIGFGYFGRPGGHIGFCRQCNVSRGEQVSQALLGWCTLRGWLTDWVAWWMGG